VPPQEDYGTMPRWDFGGLPTAAAISVAEAESPQQASSSAPAVPRPVSDTHTSSEPQAAGAPRPPAPSEASATSSSLPVYHSTSSLGRAAGASAAKSLSTAAAAAGHTLKAGKSSSSAAAALRAPGRAYPGTLQAAFSPAYGTMNSVPSAKSLSNGLAPVSLGLPKARSLAGPSLVELSAPLSTARHLGMSSSSAGEAYSRFPVATLPRTQFVPSASASGQGSAAQGSTVFYLTASQSQNAGANGSVRVQDATARPAYNNDR
jgi:hypothetical protein